MDSKKNKTRTRAARLSKTALEKQDPDSHAAFLSTIAFAEAWKEARNSGEKLVISENGAIIEISPDGTRKILKRIEGPKPTQIGRRYTIR